CAESSRQGLPRICSSDIAGRLRSTYARISTTSEEQDMKTVAEQYIEEGRQRGFEEGFEEGFKEGFEEGERRGLQRALRIVFEKRLAPPPPAVVRLIETSRPGEFEHWVRRILAATTADDLLA